MRLLPTDASDSHAEPILLVQPKSLFSGNRLIPGGGYITLGRVHDSEN